MIEPTPAAMDGGYGAIAMLPTLVVVTMAKAAENSVDYSLQNTARQALFLVTNREAKYKAKAAIDTFVMRLGDVLAAAMIWFGTRGHWGTQRLVFINLVLVLVWLAIVTALGREHRRREAV